ncbi:MAG: hypothetical protein IJ306_06780 [Oscillospiraceae bacterium]|nr:hypothetical protein [Oscillospiraceae bacterium]
MKLFGITMIFAAAAAAGFLAEEKYLSMLKGIKRAENLMVNFILGLKSERLTLSEIFENAVSSGDEKTKRFIMNIPLQKLEDAPEISEKCGFCNDRTANSILGEAFCMLGKYSADEQISELEFCRNRFRSLYEKNEEPYKMKAKLSRYAGILSGIFFAIIFF